MATWILTVSVTKRRNLSFARVVDGASQSPKQVDDVSSCLPHVMICSALTTSVLSQPANGATKEPDAFFLADKAIGSQSAGVALRRLSLYPRATFLFQAMSQQRRDRLVLICAGCPLFASGMTIEASSPKR